MSVFGLRHIGRLREVLSVLARHGYGRVVARLPLPFNLPSLRGTRSDVPLPAETRQALEELGPTFVKLGQILSTRRDLLAPQFIDEFELLQENVAPFASEEVREIIREDFGGEVEDIFDDFEAKPIGAASIAQVHAAQYRGKEVVVKVKRPGIVRTVREDMEIMKVVADMVHENVPELRYYDLPQLAREFGRALRGELDFCREADVLEMFRAGFSDWDHVVIPRVYRDLSSDRVITMDRIRGRRLAHLERDSTISRRKLARLALAMSFHQFFHLGVFHADPHPGNLMIVDDDRLALLDFGRVAVVDEHMKNQITDLMTGIIERDHFFVTDVVLTMVRSSTDANRLHLLRDMTELVEFNYQKAMKHISIAQILGELLALLGRHELVVSGEYVTLVSALITAESSARTLYPELNPVKEMRPYVRKAFFERFTAESTLRRLRRGARGLSQGLQVISRDIPALISQARRGEFTLRFWHTGLDGFLQGLDRIANRITVGLITAALIIAGSLIIGIDRPPLLFGYPTLGIVSLSVAAVLGLWLLFTRR